MEIKNRTALTKKLHQDLNWFLFNQKYKELFIYNILIVIIGIFIYISFGKLYIIIFGCLLYPLLYSINKIRDNYLLKKHNMLHNNMVNEYTFLEDYLEINSISDDISGKGTIKYSSFNKIYETDKMFVFIPSFRSAYIIDKSTFITGTSEELSELIGAKSSNYKNFMRKKR